MRRLLIFLTLILVVLAVLWALAETFIARELRTGLAGQPDIRVAETAPLRNPARIGARLTGIEVTLPGTRIALPRLDLSARSLRPNHFVADLPQRIEIRHLGQSFDLGLTAPQATVSLASLRQMTLGHLRIGAEAVTLNGRPLAAPLRLSLQPVEPDGDWPEGARSAYDVGLHVEALDPAALPGFTPPEGWPEGRITAQGQGRVWLDRLVDPQAASGGQPPRPVALELAETRLAVGHMSASLAARLRPDAQGRAEGIAVLYTADAQPIVETLAALGLIPQNAVLMLQAMMRGAAENPMPATVDFLPAQGDEIRLPLVFADGQVLFGGVPVAEAPLLIGTP